MESWIKMRCDLYRHPRVIAIADILGGLDSPLARYVNQHCQRDMTVTCNVTRHAVVGALLMVWGTVRHRGRRDGDDSVLEVASLHTLDQVSDMPGLGDAMEDVGWVVYNGETLRFPMFFKEHNADPADDRRAKDAERQRRRRAKKNDNATEEMSRDCHVTVSQKCHTRVEESREDDNTPHSPPKGESAAHRRFEDFWEVVHCKTGKVAAANAHVRAVSRVAASRGCSHNEAAEYIRQRMLAFASTPSARPADRTPIHPRTWLSQGRYDDDESAWGDRPAQNGRPEIDRTIPRD